MLVFVRMMISLWWYEKVYWQNMPQILERKPDKSSSFIFEVNRSFRRARARKRFSTYLQLAEWFSELCQNKSKLVGNEALVYLIINIYHTTFLHFFSKEIRADFLKFNIGIFLRYYLSIGIDTQNYHQSVRIN